jgi:hypothetical protein
MSKSTLACFIGWQVPVIDWKIVHVEIDIGENGEQNEESTWESKCPHEAKERNPE